MLQHNAPASHVALGRAAKQGRIAKQSSAMREKRITAG
jgi:hypothetical protein